MEFFNVFSKQNYYQDSLTIKIGNIFKSYGLTFGFVIISLIVIKIVDYLLLKYTSFPSIIDLISLKQNKIHKYPFYLTVILLPFIEEILFRLWLKTSKFNFTISSFFISFHILGGNIPAFNFGFIKYVLISLVVSLIVYFYYDKIKLILNKYHSKFILVSCILFALIHILNIDKLYWQLALLYPIYVLPQFFMGYFITNLRLKYGFLWGVSMHALINLIPFLLSNIK